jgi:glycosyltransferase involved in cell wall biosynthesis
LLQPTADVRFISAPKLPGFKPFGLVRQALQLFAQARPEVVATYNWGTIEVALAGVLSGRRVIHTEDGFGRDEATRLKRRRVLMRHLVLPRAFATVLVSNSLYRTAIETFRLPASRIRFIPNGIDTTRACGERNGSLRSAAGVPVDGIVVGTVARLQPEKNLRLLVQAIAASRPDELWLVIVGDGPCLGELREEAKRCGVEARLRFVGAVPAPWAWYRNFDIFAMSSVTEQLPMSLLEAMASGLPVVSTDVGDIGKVLRGDDVQLVRDYRPETFAGRLRELAGDPQLRATIGERNRVVVEGEYSQRRMVEEYAELYRDAAGQGR